MLGYKGWGGGGRSHDRYDHSDHSDYSGGGRQQFEEPRQPSAGNLKSIVYSLIHSSSNLVEEAAERPRLKLQPRTVKDPVNAPAGASRNDNIFGSGKPRDEKEYEKKLSQRLEKQSLSDDR